jgi:hypothetical protein
LVLRVLADAAPRRTPVAATRVAYDKSIRLMKLMLRSDWQTKVTVHAHHQPIEHQG